MLAISYNKSHNVKGKTRFKKKKKEKKKSRV